MENLNDIAEKIAGLNPSDAKTLFDIFKDEYGIEPAGGQAVFIEHVVEETEDVQTEFDVILESRGTAKLDAVKLIKEVLGLSLMESKTLVDSCPSVLKENVSAAEASTLKAKFEEIGAVIVLK